MEDIRYLFVQDTYDGYSESNNTKKSYNCGFIRPDIVAVLNCGFIFYSSWDKSIPNLLKYPEVPLIFTEYYEEDCKLNLQKIDSLGNIINLQTHLLGYSKNIWWCIDIVRIIWSSNIIFSGWWNRCSCWAFNSQSILRLPSSKDSHWIRISQIQSIKLCNVEWFHLCYQNHERVRISNCI